MFISFCMPMKRLKRERQITVYLPDNYYETKKGTLFSIFKMGKMPFLIDYHFVE